MKPHVICHMSSSIDGRTLTSRWRPKEVIPAGLYDRLHNQLTGDAWLIGRVTGQEYARSEGYAVSSDQVFPREAWIAQKGAQAYGVVLDAQGKIAWGRADIGDDPIVVVLTRSVPDAHLAGLRADGVSYVFAGDDEIDLAEALETLNRELGIERLLIEGGGVANGAFLRAGLVDEVSLLIVPAIDGSHGAPCVFDAPADLIGAPAPVSSMTLRNCEVISEGMVWLRYEVRN